MCRPLKCDAPFLICKRFSLAVSLWEVASLQKKINVRTDDWVKKSESVVLSTRYTSGCERNHCVFLASFFFFIKEIIKGKINPKGSVYLFHSLTVSLTHTSPQPPLFLSNTPDRRSLLFAHTPWPYLDAGKKRAHMIVYRWQQETVGAWLTGVAVGSRMLNAKAINQPINYQHWYIFLPYGAIFHIVGFHSSQVILIHRGLIR